MTADSGSEFVRTGAVRCADGEFHMWMVDDETPDEVCALLDGPFLGCGPHHVAAHLSSIGDSHA